MDEYIKQENKTAMYMQLRLLRCEWSNTCNQLLEKTGRYPAL
jgi:hypothetical protein